MNQDILLSKIVPNSTDTTWAQAYTTLNVYITLSIENADSKTPVTTFGKELLEKLQREFFALDDKSLENIKKAVENVRESIGEGYTHSILVGAIVGDVLYIVISSTGQVVIKRGDKVGVIATGVEGELHGFSGKLKHDDIIVFETGDFTKKIPMADLSEYLSGSDVLQISENITPLVHEGSKGTESSIILQYKDMSGIAESDSEDFVVDESHMDSHDEAGDDSRPTTVDKEGSQLYKENLWTKRENNNIEELAEENPEEERYEPEIGKSKKSLSFPKINLINKKVLIPLAVLVLIAVVVGGVALQIMNSNNQKMETEFSTIYTPIKEKFDEGVTLENLNKSLALEDFTAASNMIKDASSKFKPESSQGQKLKDLQAQIEAKITEIGGGGSAKNIKDFLTVHDKIKSITSITAKGGTLVVLDSEGEQALTIDTDGSVKKTYDIESKDDFVSADDKHIYTMGDGVTSIDRGNGKVTKIIKSIKGEAFDIFGSNLYTLTGADILKYRAPTYDSSSYFTDKPTFKSTVTGMSIAGPIYVLESDGSVESFTKGKKDEYSVSGLLAPFSTGAQIYADPEGDNIYVMDVKNQRVVALSDKGEYVTQYEGSFIKGATSFAIDEKNKTGYVVSSNKIISFDL